MKLNMLIVVISASCVQLATPQDIILRLTPQKDCCFKCSIINTNDFPTKRPISFLAYDNALVGYSFSDSTRKILKSIWNVDFVDGPVYANVEPKSRFEYFISKQMAESSIFGFDDKSEKYLHLKWIFLGSNGKVSSPAFNIAYVHEGSVMEPPVIPIIGHDNQKRIEWMLGDSLNMGETNTLVQLALIIHDTAPNELALIYISGASASDSRSLQNSEISSLLVSSSGIGYSNEITPIPSPLTNALAASESAWHWRIPWNDIWNRLPEEDRARLEMAGEVDLRWKCGDLVSDPLPLWVGPVDESEMPEEKTR